MAPSKFNYLFLTLTLTAVLLTGTARADPPVNQFCRTATYKPLCNRMVGGATNLHDAAANAMKTTIAFAKQLQDLAPKVKSAISTLPSQTRDSIISTCVEDFSGTVDDVQTALEALDQNDIGTLRTHLSAAFGTDCQDALSEFGASFPFARMQKHLMKHVDNCLAVVDQN